MGQSLFLPPLIVLLCAVCLVTPRGDFPLNDDWFFAKMVQTLLSEHRLVQHPFSEPNAAVHVLWGGMFTILFGFSFTALRLSTLVLAFVGGWATALCAHTCGLSRRASAACGVLVVCNPLYLNLAYTYMTDVPFYAFAVVSALFYLRSLKTSRISDTVLGSIFGAASFFVRQFGVCIAAAYLLTIAVWAVRRKLARPLPLFAAFAAPWAAAAVLFFLWRAQQDLPLSAWHDYYSYRPMVLRATYAVTYVLVVITYMGLFMLPATSVRLVQIVADKERWSRAQSTACLGFIFAALVAFVLIHRRAMPILTNIFYDLGAGPLTLQDAYYYQPGWSPVHLGRWWWMITLIAIASGGILVGDVARRWLVAAPQREKTKKPDPNALRVNPGQALFLTCWTALFIAASNTPYSHTAFDRYILPVLLPATIACAWALHTKTGAFADAVFRMFLCAMFVFSLMCVQDYMAWNRARWQGIDHLRNEMGIPVEQIDGGYEFNGMYTSDAFMRMLGTRDYFKQGPKRWWVLDNAYAVSFLPRKGFEEIARFPYFSWLGMEKRSILVLKKAAP